MKPILCMSNVINLYLSRCGEDLKKLFLTPTIQHFINCIPMRELQLHKLIYQPGTLRKVNDILDS